ncbi:MAG: hypothetical protein AAGA37_19565 [Actinomycetota bacterium]
MRPIPHPRPARAILRVAPVAVAAVLAAACGAGAVSDGAAPAPTPSIAINPDEPSMAEMDEPTEMDEATDTSAGAAAISIGPTADASPSLELARARCIAAPPHLEAALIDRGDDEDDDEEPELSEEELEQTYAPEFPTVDGVAAPEDRPVLEAMGVYDPTTATWEQLDQLIAHCIENDIVSEAELWGEEDEGGEEGEDDWCEELASMSAEEIREFAADDGEDLVREEFAACGLPNPLDS